MATIFKHKKTLPSEQVQTVLIKYKRENKKYVQKWKHIQ